MFNLINAFEEANIDFEVLNDKNFEIIKYWTNLLTTNRSFCLRPWITYVSYNGYRRSCERGGSALKPLIKGTDKIDWQNNEAFNNLRSRMLKGLPNEKNCEWCIKLFQERQNNGMIGHTYTDMLSFISNESW